MESDRRGDIGFPEAVMGAAAVCVVLICFLAFAYGLLAAGESDGLSTHDINTLSDSLSLQSGSYTLDGSRLEDRVSALDLAGVSVTAEASGIDSIPPCSWDSGEVSGEYSLRRSLVNVDSDDGKRIPTIVTVKVFA